MVQHNNSSPVDSARPAIGTGVFIIAPYEPKHSHQLTANIHEAEELVRALGQPVLGHHAVPLRTFHPATLIGKGSLEIIREKLLALAPPSESWETKPHLAFVYVNYPLTAAQQRNIERALGCFVEDREGLILNIFSARAHSEEGRLQVAMARLRYDQSRLVRSWTHLERQRGSTSKVGGPGERQLELDKRKIADDIKKLELKLNKVKQTRALHRKNRIKVPYPVVALVGYTNAGKSTLFNRLTGSHDLTMDLLFATLDTHLRQVKLPSHRVAIFSDTVGFISKLPTHLIAAFRATLEELESASIILHIADLASEDFFFKVREVERILDQITLPTLTKQQNSSATNHRPQGGEQKRYLIGNKYDLVVQQQRPAHPVKTEEHLSAHSDKHDVHQEDLGNNGLSDNDSHQHDSTSKGFSKGKGVNLSTDLDISAVTGHNIDKLLAMIDDELDRQEGVTTQTYQVAMDDTALPARLYQTGRVIKDEITDQDPPERHITVRLSRLQKQKLEQLPKQAWDKI